MKLPSSSAPEVNIDSVRHVAIIPIKPDPADLESTIDQLRDSIDVEDILPLWRREIAKDGTITLERVNKVQENEWATTNARLSSVALEHAPSTESLTARKNNKDIPAIIGRLIGTSALLTGIVVGAIGARSLYFQYRKNQEGDEVDEEIVPAEPNANQVEATPHTNEQTPPDIATQTPVETEPIDIVEDPYYRWALTPEIIESVLSEPATFYTHEQMGWAEGLRTKDINHDPTFRASTITIYGPQSMGTGALVELEGDLYIRTINHVLDFDMEKAVEANNFNHRVFIPGMGYTDLPEYVLAFHESKGDFEKGQDTNVLIPLRLDLVKQIREAQAEGVISPLEIATVAPADEDDAPNNIFYIPNPETGSYIQLRMVDSGDPNDNADNTHRLQVVGYETDNLAEAERVGALICAGFSGSPILDGLNLTKIHGQQSAVNVEVKYGNSTDPENPGFYDSIGRICHIFIYVQEN